LKISLATGAGVLLALSVALWFFVVQPGQEAEAIRAEEALNAGIALFDEKKYDEVLQELRRVPSGSAQEAQALYYKGSAHMMLKDYQSAALELEKSLTSNPASAGTLYALGVVYYKLGNLKLAKSYFASVLEINPNDEQAKGLMDIMAGLERQTETAKVPESEDETGT
jgi:tetratricopeptide (TPR) repeat protein